MKEDKNMTIDGKRVLPYKILIFLADTTEKDNFIIADYTDPEKPMKIFSYRFTTEEELMRCFITAEEEKVDGFVIRAETVVRRGRFKGCFQYEKDFETFKKIVFEALDDDEKHIPLKKDLKKLEKEFKKVDTRKIYAKLLELIKKYFPKAKNFPESMHPETDRDYLDLCIEMYKLLHAEANDIKYSSDEADEIILKEPFMNFLLEYKFNYYGHEIFENYGFNIMDRLENGMVKIAPMTDEELEAKDKLN